MSKKVFAVTNLVCVLLGIIDHSFFVFCYLIRALYAWDYLLEDAVETMET